jgi:hypothetical protein
VAKNNDGLLWGALIIAGVVIWNLIQPTSVTTTQDGQPVAGAGVDPYDVSPYTTEALAVAGGLIV